MRTAAQEAAPQTSLRKRFRGREEGQCMCNLRFHPWVGKIPLEKGKATHSSIFAWRIPRTEELVRLQSVRSQSQTRPKRLSMHAQAIEHITSPEHFC